MGYTKKQWWHIVAAVTFATIAEAASLLYPAVFVPRMVLHFGIPRDKVGYYAGWLNSGRYLGNMFGVLAWSSLSDRIGRRKIVIINLIASIFCNLLFGFAPYYSVAVAARVLTGLTSAVIPISKTIVYDVSETSNQFLAMSIVNFGFVIGVIVSCNMGGFLSEPYRQFTDFPEIDLLRRFPFMLPSVIYCIFAAVVIIYCFFFLMETNESSKNGNDVKSCPEHTHPATAFNETNALHLSDECVFSKQNVKRKAFEKANTQWKSLQHFDHHKSEAETLVLSSRQRGRSETCICSDQDQYTKHNTSSMRQLNFGISEFSLPTVLLEANGHPRDAERHGSPPPTETGDEDIVEQPASPSKSHVTSFRSGMISLFTKFPDFKKVLIVYMITSAATIMFEECVVLFASDSGGGLNMLPMHIGIMANLSTIFLIPFIFVLAPLNRKIGPMRVHFLGYLVGLCAIEVFPYSTFLRCEERRTTCSFVLAAMLLPERICLFYCFTCVSVLLNNSVPPNLGGTANGIAIFCSNIARITGITLGSSCLQFTLARDFPYPLDYHLVFLLIGLMLTFGAILQSFLPLHIEKQMHKVQTAAPAS